jgi:hypothetical protein
MKGKLRLKRMPKEPNIFPFLRVWEASGRLDEAENYRPGLKILPVQTRHYRLQENERGPLAIKALKTACK